MKHVNNFPWFPQGDNANNPGGTCNVTSLAMALAALGIKGDGNGQIEDQLFREAARRGLDYHEASTLVELAKWKGKRDRFSNRATWKQVREHLAKGLPVILHTWFTRSGHIVMATGFDDGAYAGRGAYIVNDPAGEWHGGGYGYNPNGKAVPYSYALMDAVVRANSYDEAMAYYNSGRVLPATYAEFWAHFLS